MTDDVHTDADDAALLAELGRAIDRHDSVPDAARLAAHGLLSWRSIDDELAELQFDSALDASGVRGMAWPRQLSFEAADTGIEVEVDGHHLIGQVVPPSEIDVTLTTSQGVRVETRSDAVGHFRFDDVESGTVRITVTGPTGSVTTQWFTI